jgi:hypothetical protein
MGMSLCSVDEFFECLDAGSIILSPGKSRILVFSGLIAITCLLDISPALVSVVFLLSRLVILTQAKWWK